MVGGAEPGCVPSHASGGTTLLAQNTLILSEALQALEGEPCAQVWVWESFMPESGHFYPLRGLPSPVVKDPQW